MNLQHRIDLFTALGNYLSKNPEGWLEARLKASLVNPWFTENFIEDAKEIIVNQYLKKEHLQAWIDRYEIKEAPEARNIGVVMAGNIPMVGFHDMLSVLITGHILHAKLSSKDEILMRFLGDTLISMEPEMAHRIFFRDMLKDCNAYIATGSTVSSRFFKQYFEKYPYLIRPSKTSVAILDGTETTDELKALSDDIHRYYGLGCRNVTKLYIPEGYDFKPLLDSFSGWLHLKDLQRYANNYDYQLSLILLNRKPYMTNGCTLLIEEENLFSPISVLHYRFYQDREFILPFLQDEPRIQCIVGHNGIPFGQSQYPKLWDYADGVDTYRFLTGIP